MSKKIILSLSLACVCLFANAQIMSSDSCLGAPVLCNIGDLANFEGRTGEDIEVITDLMLCPDGGTIENISWFAFVAGSDSVEIEITPFNCTSRDVSGQGLNGIQAGIVTKCDLSQPIICYNERSTTAKPIRIGANNFVIGQTYYFWVDGQAGALCSYRLEVISGDQAFPLPKITEAPHVVTGEGSITFDTICTGFEDYEIALNNFAADVDFYWKVSPGTTQFPADTFFVNGKTTHWDFEEEGDYEISLFAFNGCTYTDTLVKQIYVRDYKDENFGDIEICPNKYTDLPFITDTIDPNGDNEFGFQGPIPVREGLLTHEIDLANGCSYTQSVNVIDKDFDFTRQKDTVYTCSPFEYGGQMITDSFSITNINIESGQDNGCDKLVELTAHILRFNPEIKIGKCIGPGEVELYVDWGDYYFGDLNVNIDYIWMDENLNPIPEALGDSTLIVSANGLYHVVTGFEISQSINTDSLGCLTDTHSFQFENTKAGPSAPNVIKFPEVICLDSPIDTFLFDFDLDFTPYYEFPFGSEIVELLNGGVVVDFTNSNGGEVCMYVANDCGNSESICRTIEVVAVPVFDIVAMENACIDSLIDIDISGVEGDGFNYLWDIDGGSLVSGNTTGTEDLVLSYSTGGSKSVKLNASNDACGNYEFGVVIEINAPFANHVLDCSPSFDKILFEWPEDTCATEFILYVNGDLHSTITENKFLLEGLGEQQSVTFDVEYVNGCGCENLRLSVPCQTVDCSFLNVDINEPGEILCEDEWGQSKQLTVMSSGGSSESILVWEGNGIDQTGLFDPLLAGSGVHTLVIKYSDLGCQVSDTVVFDLTPSPNFDIMTFNPSCQDEIIGQFIVDVFGNKVGNYTYEMDGLVIDSFGDAGIGEHLITVIDGNNCSVAKTFRISEPVLPAYEMVGIREYFTDETMSINLNSINSESPRIDSISWTINGDVVCSGPNCSSISLDDLSGGIYNHRLVLFFDDCIMTEEFDVVVQSISEFHFPNIISPNGDGINDQLVVMTSSFNNIIESFEVFSRWGEKVYSAKDVVVVDKTVLWDAHLNGKILQPGVFVYVAKFINERGEVEIQHGDITIVR